MEALDLLKIAVFIQNNQELGLVHAIFPKQIQEVDVNNRKKERRPLHRLCALLSRITY